MCIRDRYGNYEWKRAEECKEKGITAILGVGFDPGVVNAYARLAKDDYFDKVTSVDIVDINAGSHGRWFSTNFDPEINFREFTGVVYSWQKGEWQTNQMHVIEVGDLDAYWQYISGKELEQRFAGVRLKAPHDYPWGREVHIIDPAGVCWHVRQAKNA